LAEVKSDNRAQPFWVTLVPGSRLGAYEILSLIGTGGMGELHRAHDTKLGRDAVQSSIAIDSAFSPGGHWAYARAAPGQEVGAARVYIEPVPRTGAIYPASNGQAFSPLWLPGSKALLYDVAPKSFSVVTFSTQPSVEFGNPAPLAKSGLSWSSFTQARPFDLSPDGTRILGFVEGTAPQQAAHAPPTIQVVLNWSEELKASC
jgi:hypothetical protein